MKLRGSYNGWSDTQEDQVINLFLNNAVTPEEFLFVIGYFAKECRHLAHVSLRRGFFSDRVEHALEHILERENALCDKAVYERAGGANAANKQIL